MPKLPDQQIGDIEVFVHDGKIHLFHLTLPAHQHVGHWVSEDALHWRQLP
ncbi:MAG: hypothetical protein HY360_04150 [Verrucomicrobia bacterium]|nr:hypothetical protein [Verrucomicrobiota bacterium]